MDDNNPFDDFKVMKNRAETLYPSGIVKGKLAEKIIMYLKKDNKEIDKQILKDLSEKRNG